MRQAAVGARREDTEWAELLDSSSFPSKFPGDSVDLGTPGPMLAERLHRLQRTGLAAQRADDHSPGHAHQPGRPVPPCTRRSRNLAPPCSLSARRQLVGLAPRWIAMVTRVEDHTIPTPRCGYHEYPSRKSPPPCVPRRCGRWRSRAILRRLCPCLRVARGSSACARDPPAGSRRPDAHVGVLRRPRRPRR